MSKDFFAEKAASYEQDGGRVANVRSIAGSIIERVELNNEMQLMDLGAGTGLLLEQIAPHVGKITAIDISPSMTGQLRKKQGSLGCDLDVLEMDLASTDLDAKFDGIISSMTLHHIQNVPAMFDKLYGLLDEGGFIALADLDTEDGSFHKEDTGVHHFGFSADELIGYATAAGFKNAKVDLASVINKPYGNYPVLLLTAIV